MTKENPTEAAALDLEHKSINDIGHVICGLWGEMYFGAVPYAEAMREIDASGHYLLDDWRSIVLYFLANAQTWHGPLARAVKAELQRRARTNTMNGKGAN